MQGRAPCTLTLWNMDKITTEQNTKKNQENAMHATEVHKHLVITLSQ